jgi:3-oxoacyl-[acyl-carrier-protein] synthase II
MNQRLKKRRVVVTGIGAVTPVGLSMNDTWNGIIEGISTAGPVSRFDASQMPSRIAYEVKGYRFEESLVTADERPLLNDAAKFALSAAHEAWSESALNPSLLDPARTAVCVGVGMGSPDYAWFSEVYAKQADRDASVQYLSKNYPYTVASILKRQIQAEGGAVAIHTACASSGQSLGEAFEMVAFNDADVVLTGGTDSMINPFHMAGFCLLGALSKRNHEAQVASRPFDRDRDGFVLGEGACMLVFEELEHAKRRGAKILGEVVGYGVTESAYRITDLHPEGHGPMEAMAMAIEDAGIRPSDIGYLNAHGTSTLLNDRIEALAIAKVFGGRSAKLRVSSTKSVTGHMISAAGAIEFAVCLKALEHRVLPPSTNLFNVDPQCEINLCESTPSPLPAEYALSNSVGFGGSNTALVARRYV